MKKATGRELEKLVALDSSSVVVNGCRLHQVVRGLSLRGRGEEGSWLPKGCSISHLSYSRCMKSARLSEEARPPTKGAEARWDALFGRGHAVRRRRDVEAGRDGPRRDLCRCGFIRRHV